MKRNQNRVRQNPSAGAAARQAKSAATPSLDVKHCSDGVEVAVKLQFSAEDYRRLQQAYDRGNDGLVKKMDLASYIKLAISDHVARHLYPGNPMHELELAVAQANGLIRLALEHQAFQEEEDGTDYGRRRSMELCVLSNTTIDRLKLAYDAAFSYAAGREPAPGRGEHLPMARR